MIVDIGIKVKTANINPYIIGNNMATPNITYEKGRYFNSKLVRGMEDAAKENNTKFKRKTMSIMLVMLFLYGLRITTKTVVGIATIPLIMMKYFVPVTPKIRNKAILKKG